MSTKLTRAERRARQAHRTLSGFGDPRWGRRRYEAIKRAIVELGATQRRNKRNMREAQRAGLFSVAAAFQFRVRCYRRQLRAFHRLERIFCRWGLLVYVPSEDAAPGSEDPRWEDFVLAVKTFDTACRDSREREDVPFFSDAEFIRRVGGSW